MRTKIAILYVGGAIGMRSNRKTGRIDPIESLAEIHRAIPEIQREAALEFFPIADVESVEMQPPLWTEIAETIKAHYKEFEGFVVIHGTNTLTYTAAALSFALQHLSKPVVLTGALLPINDLASDARANITFAIRTAQLDIAEVCVVSGTRVLRGVRVKKVHEAIDRTFDSTRFPAIAEFTHSYQLNPRRMVRRKRTLLFHPQFESNVCMLTLHPGIQQSFLDAVLAMNPKGILMRSYGPGMIPDSLVPWIQELTEHSIPIVMTSQVLDSAVDLHLHKKQLTLNNMGIISGKDMTYECALVKLMWALTKGKRKDRLQKCMEENVVGELDE